MMWLTVPASDVSSLSLGPPAHPKQYLLLPKPEKPEIQKKLQAWYPAKPKKIRLEHH